MLLSLRRLHATGCAPLIALALMSAPGQRASAQQTPAPASVPTPAPDAAPGGDAAVDTDPGTDTDPATDTAEPDYPEDMELSSPPTADLAGHRERELRARLDRALREEQAASLLLPWITTSVGAAMVLTGLAISVGLVAGCDHESCTGPSWPTWVMMGGALVGSLGTVWVVLESHDQAELRTRRFQIERELEYLKWNQRSGATAGPQAALSFGSRFD